MNMTTATMNPVTGGPVGGGMMMMPNNGSSPALMADNDKTPDHVYVMFNTYIYEYFIKLRHYEIARTLVKDDKFLIRTAQKQSPNHRKDGEMNGIDGDSMDMDQKDDIPDDLPRPAVAGSGVQGNGFLFDWFAVFSDLFNAHRSQNKGGSAQGGSANQYIMQYTNNQRMRETQQNQGLAGRGMMMNPNLLRNGQMRNGMMNGDMTNKRLTPQQMQTMGQGQKNMPSNNMNRGDQAEGDPNVRPASPAEGENGGSPPKRPRLEGGQQQFPPGMMQPGRPGVPGAGQQGMMIQNSFNPAMSQQFRQNGGMPPQKMAANMANGMMSMPNASSPMMQTMNQFPDGVPMEMYAGNRMPNPAAMQGAQNGVQSGNHALQDYQMQLMLLEQQNKKRLMMARQEQHDSTNPRDGQPMAGGVGMQPGMSPSGSKTGTSPNPAEQMRRTPQMGGMPGSPSGDMARQSPAAMNYMNNGIQPEFNFMKDGQMIPGGPGMRPPNADMNAMNRAPAQPGQQAQVRMQFPGSQPMQQQQSQGQPQQSGKMAPPPPAATNSAQRNQAASPANSNPNPPTPSTSNKANPKKKAANKDAGDRKRPAKKASTANAPSSEENPPATPTPSTPITPVNPANFNGSGGKGLPQGAPQANQQAQQNANMAQNQHPMPNNDMQNGFPDFSNPEPISNFNLDFSTLENSDVLENFDFDSFLNTSNDETFSFGDSGMGDQFGMDPTEN